MGAPEIIILLVGCGGPLLILSTIVLVIKKKKGNVWKGLAFFFALIIVWLGVALFRTVTTLPVQIVQAPTPPPQPVYTQPTPKALATQAQLPGQQTRAAEVKEYADQLENRKVEYDPVVPLATDNRPGCPTGCKTQPPGCTIKGNISVTTGAKIYYLSGQPDYAATTIDPSFGERWFCTEDEANMNGWRKSLQ